jgi:predicted Na+-dependent transporter
MEVLMEAFLAYLILPVLIGIAYFAIITSIKKSKDMTYKQGLILPVFFLVMSFINTSQDSSGWSSFGRGIISFLILIILVTYLLSWLIVTLVNKSKKI